MCHHVGNQLMNRKHGTFCGQQVRLPGKVTTLLTQATELAIRGGNESIRAELIYQAADNGIYKIAPQDSEEPYLQFFGRGRARNAKSDRRIW